MLWERGLNRILTPSPLTRLQVHIHTHIDEGRHHSILTPHTRPKPKRTKCRCERGSLPHGQAGYLMRVSISQSEGSARMVKWWSREGSCVVRQVKRKRGTRTCTGSEGTWKKQREPPGHDTCAVPLTGKSTIVTTKQHAVQHQNHMCLSTSPDFHSQASHSLQSSHQKQSSLSSPTSLTRLPQAIC